MIVKRSDKWCLFSSDGTKVLGCFPTLARAQIQEMTEMTEMNEQLALLPGETLDSFIMKLRAAIEEEFEFDGTLLDLAELTSDSLVGCMFTEDGGEVCTRVSYRRMADGSFEIGDDLTPVSRVITFEPIEDGNEEATTGAAVPTIPDSSGKKRKGLRRRKSQKKAYASTDGQPLDDAVDKPTDAQRSDLPDEAYAAVFETNEGQSRRILPHHVNSVDDPNSDETVDLPRLRNALARFNQLKDVPENVKSRALRHIESHAARLEVGGRSEEEQAEIANIIADCRKLRGLETFPETQVMEDVSLKTEGFVETSPNGKPFLAILEGRLGKVDHINENGRLYPRREMERNVARIKERIAKAFANPSSNNSDIILGEADHPTDGPRLLASCTQLLDVTLEGDDLRGKFGLMDISSGRDVVALREYGVPLGVSTRSIGRGEIRQMDETHECFTKNQVFAGQSFEEIIEFTIEAADLVVHPAAGTFIDESVEEDKRGELKETYERLCKPGDPSCECKTETRDITETKLQEDKEMDEKTQETLGQLTVEQLKEAAPALFDAVVASAKEEVKTDEVKTESVEPAPEAKTESTDDGRVAKLEELLREQSATVETLKGVVEKVVADKTAAEHELSLSQAIGKVCEGKSLRERRERHIRALLGTSRPENLSEAVENASKHFDDDTRAFVDVLESEGEVNAHAAVKTESVDNGVAALGGLLSFPLTSAPQDN